MIRTFLIACCLLAALPVRAMEIVEVTSEGGITAWVVSEPSIPMIALEIEFRGGTALDPADKIGATNLMMGLIEEGSRDLTTTEFAAAAEDLAARFAYDARRDGVSVSATMLSENRDASIDLLAGALTEPTFGQVAFDRVKGQVLSNLRSDSTDPNAIAGRRFSELSYPADHPYSRASDGKIETVTALTREDIVTAHRNAMVRSRVVVGVVGDITPEEVGPMLDRLLGDLPEDGPDLPVKAQVVEAADIDVVPLETPQSVALFGHSGIERDSPDFMAAYVLSEILGGSGLDSRLKTEVREKRGLTYGIYTYLGSGEYGDTYAGSVASANESMAEVVDLVREEWRKIASEGITEDELAATKRYLTGAYPLRFSGNGQIAAGLVGMQIADLPIDYIDTRNDEMNALTLEEVNEVARSLFKPEKLRFVVVGQPEGLSSE
ncbi:M16 family metallopeptidase [Halovulum sp. GXIMD14793]